MYLLLSCVHVRRVLHARSAEGRQGQLLKLPFLSMHSFGKQDEDDDNGDTDDDDNDEGHDDAENDD